MNRSGVIPEGTSEAELREHHLQVWRELLDEHAVALMYKRAFRFIARRHPDMDPHEAEDIAHEAVLDLMERRAPPYDRIDSRGLWQPAQNTMYWFYHRCLLTASRNLGQEPLMRGQGFRTRNTDWDQPEGIHTLVEFDFTQVSDPHPNSEEERVFHSYLLNIEAALRSRINENFVQRYIDVVHLLLEGRGIEEIAQAQGVRKSRIQTVIAKTRRLLIEERDAGNLVLPQGTGVLLGSFVRGEA